MLLRPSCMITHKVNAQFHSHLEIENSTFESGLPNTILFKFMNVKLLSNFSFVKKTDSNIIKLMYKSLHRIDIFTQKNNN